MLGFAKRLVKQAEGIIAPEVAENVPSHGFRVLWTGEGTAARDAGLEPLFDYIVSVGGHELRSAKTLQYSEAGAAIEVETSPVKEFQKLLDSPDTASVELGVWSAKGRQIRQVYVPTEDSGTKSLGMQVQWTPISTADAVWHVLEVSPGSPAEQAGLVGHADYIVGAERGLLESSSGGEALLGRVVSRIASESTDSAVTLFVYNHDYDTVRPVRISPIRDVRGNWLLGCGVGYGLLHRLPAVERRLAPGETLFVDEAALAPPMPSLSSPKPGSDQQQDSPLHLAPHHNHQHHHGKPKVDLSGYFDEQTKISRERDTPASSSSKGSIPPPPKAT